MAVVVGRSTRSLDSTTIDMAHIENPTDYLASFEGKEKEALTEALEARKLEIDLYWRRVTYFWTLSTVAFTGFFASQTSEKVPKSSLVTICCIGFLFALAWFLASRGARYWQQNWETQVDMLEDKVIGPMFKTNVDATASKWKLLDGYPFSVAKINQLLSLFLTIVWVILLFQSCREAGIGFTGVLTETGGVLMVTLIFAIAMLVGGPSSRNQDRTIKMTRRTYK